MLTDQRLIDQRLQQVLPAVSGALADHLVREEGEQLRSLSQVKVLRRPYSSVVLLTAETSAGPRRLVLKTTEHHPVNRAITESRNQALVEYNVLKLLHPHFVGSQGCSVPRPILVLPERETYLMEFVDGAMLSDQHRFSRYLAPRRGFEALRRNYRYCGQWLRRFVEVTGIRAGGREALQGVRERCEHRLRLIEASRDPRYPPDLLARTLDFLERQLSRIPERSVPVSGRHSDFGPWNIIAGPLGITVIDFFGFEDDPIAVDLLKMLVYLEDEKSCLTNSRTRLGQLQEEFLKGYGEVPPVPLPALLVCEAMQRVVSVWASLSNRRTRLHQRIEAGRKLKANLRWLTSPEPRAPLLTLDRRPGGSPCEGP